MIAAQGAKCQNIGIVGLRVRFRELKKPWLFHVLADLEYPCILGIDFISGSKIIFDLKRKLLVIPDSQIDKAVKTIEERKVEIGLSKTKLGEKQKQDLRDLFNSFQGLFSDKPELTDVLYHEIDAGDTHLLFSSLSLRQASGLWCQLDYANNCLTILLCTRSLPRQLTVALHTQWRIVLKGSKTTTVGRRGSAVGACVGHLLVCEETGLEKLEEKEERGKEGEREKEKKESSKRRGLVVLGKGEENPRVLFRDADQESKTRMRKNALRTGPRQAVRRLAVNPSDITKTAFFTKNDTYEFRRMPLGLLGSTPNFQKAVDTILKPVIGKKRSRTEETVMPNTSSYSLRPRSGRRVKSRPTMEMNTQQGGTVRARKSKGRNYNPYI
ncbi:uncharacterized protein TNCV_1092261 [Trichonephila clavipes]|nr:uncharacterized protein TNCV_1092261 [Trichonephila clavipes]